MKRRYWVWVVVLIAASVGWKVWLREPEHGKVTVRFEQWEQFNMRPCLVLNIHNGTGTDINVAEVVATKLGPLEHSLTMGPVKQGITMRAVPVHTRLSSDSSLEGIEPGTDCRLFVEQYPHDSSSVAEVYIYPWTLKQAKDATARNANFPNWITRWLRQYPRRDSEHRYSVENPKEGL